MEIQGVKDLRMIENMITHPQWEMPEGVYASLPQQVHEIVTAKDDKGAFIHSISARMKAVRLLMMMTGQNIKAAPPTQNLNITGDLHASVEQLRSQNASDEDLELLASASTVLQRFQPSSSGEHD